MDSGEIIASVILEAPESMLSTSSDTWVSVPMGTLE